VVAATALVLLTAGCTSSDDSSAAPPRTTPSSSTPAPRAGFDPETGTVTRVEAAFSVQTGNVRTRACYEPRSSELASIDYTWRAAADVEVTEVELIDGTGIRLVGTPVTVPPVNYGGRIDLGGELTWAGHEKRLAGNHLLSWPGHESVADHVFSRGQTGLFVLHVRRSMGHGSSHGLRVTYRVSGPGDGNTYTAEVRNQVRWQVVRHGTRCRV
jgi:hypothetical protein